MKFITHLFTVCFVSLVVLQACVNPVNTSQKESSEEEPAPWDLVEEGQQPARADAAPTPKYDSTALDSVQEAMAKNDTTTMPPLRGLGAKYSSVYNLGVIFNDSNKYQYAAGERIGIKPITSVADAYFTRRPLKKVKSGDYYTVTELTHSMPYLVPEAASLLETIGKNFRDSLKRKNLGDHRIYVTSLLRTAHSVKSLQRVNINATDSSTHKLGTTFDIAYASFEKLPNAPFVSEEELRFVLAEVLRDLRASHKCMVKYEVKSTCFHVTATGR